MKRRKVLWIAVATLLLASLACNVGAISGEDLIGEPPQPQPTKGEVDEGSAESGSQAEADQTGDVVPPEADTEEEDQSLPVSINDGLASLNSYRLTVRTESTGPTAVDRSSSDLEMAHSEEADATYTRSENFTQDVDNPEGSTDLSEAYQIGNDTCNVSEDSAEWESMTVMERELTDLITSALDFKPPIEDPTFVGEEQVNGVATSHYQFQITGLGDTGAEVVRSDGEYWMAIDGRYLVRYNLDLELRGTPEGSDEVQAVSSTTSLELTEINAPLSITFPQICLDAQTEGDDS